MVMCTCKEIEDMILFTQYREIISLMPFLEKWMLRTAELKKRFLKNPLAGSFSG